MYFIHYNAEKVPVEVVAIVTVDGADTNTTKAAVPGVSLPTRWVRLAPEGETAAPSTSKIEPWTKKALEPGSVTMRLGAVGLGLAALIGLSMFLPLRRPTSAPSASEPQRYLYCPQCGLEMTCPVDQETRATFCPHCGKSQPMEVNTSSHAGSEGPPLSPTIKVLLAVAIGLPVVLAVLAYQFGRQRTPKGAVNVFACPACGHKLRSQIVGPGSTAVCPTCAEHFLVGAAHPAAEAPRNGNKSGSRLANKVGGERLAGR
jgi:transcription elongation factor Elf1